MLTSKNVMIRSAVALVAFAATMIPARAQSSPIPVFSAANITFGETLRANIVNLGDPTFPPDPCNVQVTFTNTLGQTVKTTSLTVNVGEIGGATINFLEASQAKVSVSADSVLRQVIHPVITVVPPGPCRFVMSLEVYDSTSGKTNQYIAPIYLPAVQTPVAAN